MKKNVFFLAVFLTALFFVMISCSHSSSTEENNDMEAKNVPVEKVSLNRSSLFLDLYESVTLTATVYPYNATNQAVSWSCTKSNITVEDNGNGTATVYARDIGTATIIVTTKDGGFTGVCEISVSAPAVSVNGLWIQNGYLALAPGKHTTMDVIVYPENATNQKIWWTTDSDLITISDYGNYVDIFVSESAWNGLEAIITATTEDGGYSQQCFVGVYEDTPEYIPVEWISLNYDSISMSPNSYAAIYASVYPENATNQNISWTTDSDYVSILNNYGSMVEIWVSEYAWDGLTAMITAMTEDGGYSQSCYVSVYKDTAEYIPVEWISLNYDSLSMTPCSYNTLYATVYPYDATNQNVQWTSDSDYVSICNNYGNYVEIFVPEYAWDGLTATITATTEDGGYSQSCYVTVESTTEYIAVEGISLNCEDLAMTPSSYDYLYATVYPENATNQNISWTSDNDYVSILNNYGSMVEIWVSEYAWDGLAATITATTEDGEYSQSCRITVNGPKYKTEVVSVSYPEIGKFSYSLLNDKASFSAPSLSADYIWRVDDEVKEGNTRLFSINTTSLSVGIHSVFVVVKTSTGNAYSANWILKVTDNNASIVQ